MRIMRPYGLIIILYLLTIPNWASTLVLTEQEQDWIRRHPTIRMGVDPDRSPIEFLDEKGTHHGIASSVVSQIEKKTGLHFEVVPGLNWVGVLDAAEERRVDVVTAMQPTGEREAFLTFTEPYLHIPFVIVTHKKSSYVDGPADLRGKTVGVVRAYYSAELMKPYADSGDIQIEYFQNYGQALRHLNDGFLFAVVGNLVAVAHEMQLHDYSLRVAATLHRDNVTVMGVRKDWPELVSILNKTIASISDEERSAIKNQWIHSRVVIGADWNQIILIAGAMLALLLVVIAVFTAWNHRLQKEVHERKLAENKALESENKFRMLFENVQQGFSLHELSNDEDDSSFDSVFLEGNPALQKLIGVDPSLLVGKRAADIFAFGREWIIPFGKVADSGEPICVEMQIPPFDRWFLAWVFSPEPRRFAVLLSDITDQRQRSEKMRIQNESMGHFIYTISHDLKTPLLTVSSFLNELREDLNSGDQNAVQTDLEYIQTSIRRMTNLLDELRQVAQADSRKLHITEFSYHELLQEVYKAVAGRYTSRHIEFRIASPDRVLRADRSRIFQLLQNLLDNAAKYMGTAAQPWVEAGCNARGGEWVYYVRDNGIGIAAEDVKRIFGIFEKVSAASEGSGIGLTLVQRTVEAHRGRVWVTSPGVNAGSEFCFTLGQF